MAAHLAGKPNLQLSHLFLNQAVTRFPHNRDGPVPQDLLFQGLGTFHIEYHRLARPGHLLEKHAHEGVGPDNVPLVVHHPDPIGVAVIGHT